MNAFKMFKPFNSFKTYFGRFSAALFFSGGLNDLNVLNDWNIFGDYNG